MTTYFLDTNHLARAVDPRSNLLSRIRTELTAGSTIGTCAPVRCEIEAGIQQVADPPRYRRALDRLLDCVRVWPLDRKTTVLYGELFNDLRRRGRVLSQVDIMIAALARQRDACVLTTDGDLDAVPGLRRENWLL